MQREYLKKYLMKILIQCHILKSMGLRLWKTPVFLPVPSAVSWMQNPGPLSELLGGKEKVMGFFVGQIMKRNEGKGKSGKRPGSTI